MFVSTKARIWVALFFLVTALFIQVVGVFPWVECLAGAFPSHYHRDESSWLSLILLVSLIGGGWFNGFVARISLVFIGALGAYALAKLPFSIGGGESLFWGCAGVRVAFIVILGWIYLGGWRESVLNWREAFYSLFLAYLGLIYLSVVSVLVV